jgi:hypothetical protein
MSVGFEALTRAGKLYHENWYGGQHADVINDLIESSIVGNKPTSRHNSVVYVSVGGAVCVHVGVHVLCASDV